MVWFIIALIFFIAALIAIGVAVFTDSKVGGALTAAGLIFVGAILMFIATFWSNGVGEAKVMVNSVDRTVVGTIDEPGSGFKPAWVDFVEFDLFAQELLYAGSKDEAPVYTGGTVDGAEVTVTTGGLNGGSTRANLDLSVVYSLDADNIETIYEDFRSQERFTQMVVNKTVLSVVRTAPQGFTAQEFRGPKKDEVGDIIMDKANDKLAEYGITIDFVNLQDPRFTKEVEASLDAIEQSNQAAQKAEADQRTATALAEKQRIEAEGDANAAIERAQGEAEANAILSASLSPEVLQQRYLDTLALLAAEGNLVITDGTGSQILVQK